MGEVISEVMGWWEVVMIWGRGVVVVGTESETWPWLESVLTSQSHCPPKLVRASSSWV